MITVIENENVVSNPYPGMNLAEACGQLMLETEQIFNEMEMDILLAEHAYLYENGVEIEYVTEGEENENGKNIKERVVKAITDFGKRIAEFFDKIIEFVRERVNEIKVFLQKKGISQKHVAAVDAVFEKALPNGLEKKLNHVDYEKFQNEWRKYFAYKNGDQFENDIDPETAIELLKAYKEEKTLVIKKAEFDDAVRFATNENTMIKDIKKQKKECAANINKLISDVRKAKPNSKDADIAQYKNVAKMNSKYAAACCKLYRDYLAENIEIVKAVFNNEAIKEAIAAGRKEKSEYNKAMVKGTVKGAGEVVAKDAKTVKDNVARAMSKEGRAEMKENREAKKEAKKEEKIQKKKEKTLNASDNKVDYNYYWKDEDNLDESASFFARKQSKYFEE